MVPVDSIEQQTVTKCDHFLSALCKREIYENATFEIVDEAGETKTVTGVCLICDGGYMKDSFLFDPYAF